MAVDFKPHDSTGKLASRWLTQSGTLSKAEQFFLDKWMTRTSVELRDTIARECIRLYDIGVFDDMPNMRIIPQIETIAEASARKFLAWTEKVRDAIPLVVRSGFRSLRDLTKTEHNNAKDIDPFAEVVAAEEKPDYSPSFYCNSESTIKEGFIWKRAMVNAATIVLGTPDLKHPFFSAFPSLEEATIFTFHHEAAHGALLARETFNPISVQVNCLAPYSSEDDIKKSRTWERDSWAALFCVRPENFGHEGDKIKMFQTLWGEYYADVGASLMHARAGYSSEYITPLANARAEGSRDHQTNPVLEKLIQVLDFHPVVLNKKIDASYLHEAIGRAIAPQIGHDVLAIIKSSPLLSGMLESALPALPDTNEVLSPGFEAMNEALGGDYPKLALFFAKLKDGPNVATVTNAYNGPIMGQQPTDQMAMA
jgi:hypothetical protein